MDSFDSGYSVQSPVLSWGECDTLLEELGKSTTAGRAGTRHMMSNSAVHQLANDGRLLRIAKEVLGFTSMPFRATLLAKSGLANWLIPWHQDTALPLVDKFDDPDWVSWSHAPAWALSRVVALRVHLDASTPENGPLRVVPGSHRAGVLTDQGVSEYVSRHSHATCLVPKGGILEYSDLLELKPGIRLAVG
jgi:ectoine hydroxylase-related dioxygenase (phytanoyl-CoA dioxygenase family)